MSKSAKWLDEASKKVDELRRYKIEELLDVEWKVDFRVRPELIQTKWGKRVEFGVLPLKMDRGKILVSPEWFKKVVQAIAINEDTKFVFMRDLYGNLILSIVEEGKK